MIIPHEKKKFFKKNGYVILKKIVSKKTCKLCIESLKNYKNYDLAKKNKHAVFEKKNKKEYIKYFKKINLYIDEFNYLISSQILTISKELLGQNVYYYNMGLHNKLPQASYATPPHQDNFYWCRKPNVALTAYVALTDQSKSNGGIGYLAGSHKKKLHDHKKSNVAAFSSYIHDKKILNSTFDYPKLNIGDVVFHHSNVVHLAAPNSSATKDRKSAAITIYGDKTKLDLNIYKKYSKILKP
jgi:phytanoyl-CoA hydroxylase